MRPHREQHLVSRIGWLRAAVLGANDGIVSTASLLLGVAAAGAERPAILIAGVAGLVAGAMSMAAGEYVSVSSQADTEQSDISRERRELASAPEAEHVELAAIYESRGVDPDTARAVAEQMMAFDALGAHARDELHITELTTARPVLAADFGRDVHRGCCLAAAACGTVANGPDRCRGSGRIDPVPRPSGRGRCHCRWCPTLETGRARRLLGCARHGLDGRHRQAGGDEALIRPRGSARRSSRPPA
jgi:VIT1/CCC1 family predicted Fe2+/Mn2+ transporter